MFEIMLSMIIWGTLGAFVLWSKLSMIFVAFSRCIIGGFLLALYGLYKGDFNRHIFPRKECLLAIVSGFFLVANWYFLFESFRLASITIGNVSYYLQPLFLVTLAIYFFKEPVSKEKWIYILLSFVGVILITGVFHFHSSVNNKTLQGAGCAILAGLLYAFVSVITKKIKIMPVAMVTLVQLLSGALFFIPFLHFSTGYFISNIALLCVVIMGTVHTAIAYILYYNGIKKVSFSVISVLSYLDPIVAVITDIIFFHRHLSILQIAGVMITLFSSYCVVSNPFKKIIHNEGLYHESK